MAIKRTWHGWTTPENADAYRAVLHREVFPGIEEMGIAGYRGITLLRRDLPDEVEFVTIMDFDTIDDVIAFRGDDYERCYVPDAAQRLLKRWNDRSAHYEVMPAACESSTLPGSAPAPPWFLRGLMTSTESAGGPMRARWLRDPGSAEPERAPGRPSSHRCRGRLPSCVCRGRAR